MMICEENKKVVETLKDALGMAKDNPAATEVLIFMRVGDEYFRFSSELDSIQFLAFLELAKYDVLRQMTVGKDETGSFVLIN